MEIWSSTGVAILGALCGTLGSVLTAFSVNATLDELKFARESLERTALMSLKEGGDVLVVTGHDKRIAAATKRDAWKLRIGVSLLALGFILQAASTWMGTQNGK